jgi:hypothetical protein
VCLLIDRFHAFWKQCMKGEMEMSTILKWFLDGFQNLSDRECLKSSDF